MKPDSTVTEILRIASPQARLITAMFIAVYVVLDLTNLADLRYPALSIAAVVLVAGAAILITQPAPEPFPLRRSAIILGLVTVSSLLVDANLHPAIPQNYATWYLGANTLVLLILGLRGRSWLAWLGFGAIVLLALLWTVTLGGGSLALIGLLPNQVGTLLVGTLFAIGLRRTSARITELHAEQAALASAESATRAAAAERARQAASLNAVARAALERIARGAPYADDERESWMRLEASVRDSLRAPSLTSVALTTAANNARERGVEVTLLDDSAGVLDEADNRAAVETAIIDQLGRLRTGRLIGRVLPRGRGSLATILVDDGLSTQRTDVTES
ncbi:hypothetical protein BH11ACT2_BH11ACT2_02570 [soil metagenome]